jgi:hypothetical protein
VVVGGARDYLIFRGRLVLAQVGVIPDQSPMMLSDGECLLSVPCTWLSS